MQRCGLCSLLSALLRRAVCGASNPSIQSSSDRRDESDGESNYEFSLSHPHQYAHGDRSFATREMTRAMSCSEENLLSAIDTNSSKRTAAQNRFLTMHKRRRKRLTTKALLQDLALLDDIQHGQVQCILSQSSRWRFNAFTLENVSGGHSLPALCVHLFHLYGLLDHFDLDVASVWKLFSLIEEGYHSSNPFHNSVHATDVTQAMHCFLQQDKIREHLEPVEILASLIGAVAHDVDHPGVNQPFLIATSNHLAALYQNSSVLENHHWRSAIGCIMESGIAEQLSNVWTQLTNHISALILATDITRQQEFLTQFKNYIDEATLDMTNPQHRQFVLQIALKCADISNPCRPWEISKKWSMKVCEEFFRQGDYERKLNIPISALCDRYATSIPKIQAGFFKYVVIPLMKEWHRFLQSDLTFQMMQNLHYNQAKWEKMVEEELIQEIKAKMAAAEFIDNDQEVNVDSTSSDMLFPEDQMQDTASALPVREEPADSGKKETEYKPCFSVPTAYKVGLDMFNAARQECSTSSAGQGKEKQMEGDELGLKDSDFSFRSTTNVNKEVKDIDNTMISAENLVMEHSIATMTSSSDVSKLTNILHGTGSSKTLQRQQTFPPVQRIPRTRYLSATDEKPSREEALIEQSTSSDTSSDSSPLFTKALIEKHPEYDSETSSSSSEDSSLETESSESLIVTKDKKDLIKKSDKKVTLAVAESLDDSDEGKKKNLDITSSIIRKHIQHRRGSAPCDTYSEFKKSNFNFALAHKNTLPRCNSGDVEQTLPLIPYEEPISENLIWCRWIHRSRCDNSYVKAKRRGSLPVDVLAMSGNVCH